MQGLWTSIEDAVRSIAFAMGKRTRLEASDFSIIGGSYERLVRLGFCPRKGMRPVRLALPLDWDIDPLGDGNWCFHLHAWRMLEPLWNQFHGKDWRRLRDEVLPWVRDWHRYHLIEGRTARFSWHDMATGFRAQHLALLVSLHDSRAMRLDPADLAMVLQLARLHYERMREKGFIKRNNHGVFQVVGLRLLGAACEGRRGFEGEKELTARALERLLDSQFDDRGVHRENSPEYHKLILKQFARIRPELFPRVAGALRATVLKASEVLPWFSLPDRRIAPIGDSEGVGVRLPGDASADASLEAPDGRRFLVRDLSGSGYVIARTDPSVARRRSEMLLMRGRSLSATHAHDDALSVIFFAKGRMILDDSGKYTYAKDAWRDYFTSERAHNVVGFGDARMPFVELSDEAGSLQLVHVQDDQLLIQGCTVRDSSSKHTRTLRYRPGRSLEIHDRIETPPDGVPVAYWHLAFGLCVEPAGDWIEILDNGIVIARLRTSDPGARPLIVHGRQRPEIQGWSSPRFGKKVPVTVVEVHYPAGTMAFDTTLELVDSRRKLKDGALPRPLPHGLRFRFPHVFQRDRTVPLDDGRLQRRIVVDLPDPNLARIEKTLVDALTTKGFAPSSPRWMGEARNLRFEHPDGTRVIINLRVAEQVSGARRGTLYFAWTD